MIHNFGNSFKAILEGAEKNQRHSTKNKVMTALTARDRERAHKVWLTEFALGFRLYTDISLLKMIPKVKSF